MSGSGFGARALVRATAANAGTVVAANFSAEIPDLVLFAMNRLRAAWFKPGA
jgi:hypothetical protein